MIITSIRTRRVESTDRNLLALLDESIVELVEGSIVAVTSKIVSLCEGGVVPRVQTDKTTLIEQQADYYLPSHTSKYGHAFTITQHTLIPSAGIDESNADDMFVLWPKDPQASANLIRRHVAKRFKLKQLGVIITDSTCTPLRLGTSGIALSHSGFAAVHDYVGKPDLFGRPFNVTQSNVLGGLAAAAVLTMGEGAEQTPLAVISEVPFVAFQPRDPTSQELDAIRIPPADDLFAPFMNSVKWRKGGGGN